MFQMVVHYLKYIFKFCWLFSLENVFLDIPCRPARAHADTNTAPTLINGNSAKHNTFLLSRAGEMPQEKGNIDSFTID